MVNTKSVKRAEITIEMAIAIAMSVVVVLLVLKLFGGNISTIVKNSGIGRLLYKDNSIAKTAWADDPTKTQINVQIVADQGSLAQYHNDAAAAIERYETESHTDTLTAENLENLALQLTIYAESGPTGVRPNELLMAKFAKNPALTYVQFGINHGVRLYLTQYMTTAMLSNQVGKKYQWGMKKYDTNCDYHSTDLSARVKNIEAIRENFH